MERKQSPFKGKVKTDAVKDVINRPLSERKKPKDEEDHKEFIERQILTAAIVDTEFCSWAKKSFPISILESDSARIILSWIFEYFDKFGNIAPHRDIQDIFRDKQKEGLDPDRAGLIANTLDDLSTKYDAGTMNLEFIKYRAARYRDRQALKRKVEDAEQLIKNNQLEDAVDILQYDLKASASDNLLSKLQGVLYTSTEFQKRDIQRPKRLLRPWLAEGSLTLIYGPRGIGKTWLSCVVGIVLTRTEQEDLDIGTWEAKHRAGVLYVDGEMNNWEMQDNIKELCEPLAPEDPDNPLLILSQHDFAHEYERQINIGQEESRAAIFKLLKTDRRIKVLVLDNAAALSPGVIENVKEDWDPINQWLISLRHLGVAVIVIHHAGKAGQQRGTSGREDAMDTIIKLSYPKDYDPAKDYAYFQSSFDKARNLQPGESKNPFTLRIVEHPAGGLTWHVEEVKQGNGKAEQKEKIMAELVRGERNTKQIAEMFGKTPGWISAIKKEARGRGILDVDGKPTLEGFQLMERVDALSSKD